MRNLIILLFIAIFVLSGCGAGEVESLAGYMVIEGNLLRLDEVELITTEDSERVAKLGLSESDMPGGYCIYNEEENWQELKLTNKTTYTFVDYNMLFVKDKNSDRLYTTTKKEEFIQHLETSYTDSPPAQTVPFFVEIKDGKLISVTEEFRFTI